MEDVNDWRIATWLEVAHFIDLFTFFLACIINGVLINLIQSHSPKNFGNYTYLMLGFAANSLVFAMIHAFIQPIISIEKYVVFVFTSTNYLEFPRVVMRGFLAGYGVTYSQTLVLIAIQFIYRCFSICRRKYLYYFRGKYLLFWHLLVLAFGLNWGGCIFIIARETAEVDAILRPAMNQTFNLEMEQVYYVAASYKTQNSIGEKELNTSVILMVLNFACVLSFSFGVIILCLYFINFRMKRFSYSEVYENIQKQLFRALMCQMIIPLVLIYTPIIGVLILPLFNIENNASISITSILMSIYPVLDPIAVICVISAYRVVLIGMFTERKKYRAEGHNFSIA